MKLYKNGSEKMFECKKLDCKFKTDSVFKMILHYLIKETTKEQEKDILDMITEMIH